VSDLRRLTQVYAEADAAYEADLVELQAAGFDETVADEWAANPEPDPDTDGKGHD
jgi:hypothetical protein